MTKIYKIVLDEQKYNKLVEEGWTPSPPVLYKVFDVDYETNAAKTVVDLFNDQIWQQAFLANDDLKEYLKKRGIRFGKGTIVQNAKMIKIEAFFISLYNLKIRFAFAVVCSATTS